MNDYLVPPKTRKSLRKIAQSYRAAFRSGPKFEIFKILEFVLPQADPDFRFEVDDKECHRRNNHAFCEPDNKRIVATEEIYLGAKNGDGFGRMTLCHEFGHLILHGGIDPVYARSKPVQEIQAYESVEWQAKAFAGECMIDYRLIEPWMSQWDVAQLFGVTPRRRRLPIEEI